jgi:hypothetical protein
VKYVVMRDGEYYACFVEGVPVWRRTRTFFEREEAQRIARQLVALGFAGAEALEFHPSAMKRGRR